MKSNTFSPFSYLSQTLISTYYLLESPYIDPDKKIHAIRVMSKRIRSLLYFIKPFFENRDFIKSQMELYKQLSKELGQKREIKVLDDTFNWIIKKNELQIDDFAGIKERIEHEIGLVNQKNDDIHTSEESILKAFGTLGAYKEVVISKKKIKTRLKKTYIKTYDILKLALQTNQMEDIHRFRKYAKYYMYQIQSLPSKIHYPPKRMKKLDKLTLFLGRIHDIDFLDNYIKQYKELDNEYALLKQHMDAAQNKLISKAFGLSQKIFKESNQT